MNLPKVTPILKADRLVLSEFEVHDKEAVFAYASHPQIAETVTWEAHKSIEDSLAFIRFVSDRKNFEDGKVFLAWALRDGSTGPAIGSISFSQHSSISAQIDYALGVSYWNKGLMTEATQQVIRWAFDNYPGLQRIQASCLPHNIGSRRVMEKSGMKFEGIRRSSMVVKGQIIDLAVYAVVRADLSE